jgi:hypothetical protein
MSRAELRAWVRELEERMHAAAKRLAFEEAAELRDLLLEAKLLLEGDAPTAKKKSSGPLKGKNGCTAPGHMDKIEAKAKRRKRA